MATRIKLKARPVLTLADLTKAAWPRVTTDPIHVSTLVSGEPHNYKVRPVVLANMIVAMRCMMCGEPCQEQFPVDGRPGVCCETCLTLYSEPLATETGPDSIVDVREG